MHVSELAIYPIKSSRQISLNEVQITHTGFMHDRRWILADGFPFLLTTEASLADQNSRLEHPVPIKRFRPNIVIAGAQAFAEDGWKLIEE